MPRSHSAPWRRYSFARRALAFSSSSSGATAVVFAVAAVPAMAFIGVTIDYANGVRAQAALQAAADSAALAGAAAIKQHQSTDTASQLARSTLMANLANLAPSATVQDVKSSTENNTGSTTISARLAFTGQFMRMLRVPDMQLTAQATAQAYLAETAVNGHLYSGGGAIYGDPEINFANGAVGFIDCPPGNWYSALSDSGIQVNFSCQTGVGGYNYIRDATVLVGDHVIRYSAYQGSETQYTMSQVGYYDKAWPAKIVIDGVDDVPPNSVYHAPWLSYPPARTVIDDDSGKVSITPVNDAYVNLARTGDYSYSYITVESGPYKVRLAFVNGDGAIDFTAANAGMCGIPGGAWGSSLSGRNVGHTQPYGGGYSQIASYQVTSAATKSPQFYWSRTCARTAAINNAGVAHLIK